MDEQVNRGSFLENYLLIGETFENRPRDVVDWLDAKKTLRSGRVYRLTML